MRLRAWLWFWFHLVGINECEDQIREIIILVSMHASPMRGLPPAPQVWTMDFSTRDDRKSRASRAKNTSGTALVRTSLASMAPGDGTASMDLVSRLVVRVSSE